MRSNPRTRRCFDIHATSFQRYGCCMDIETTSCAYWETTLQGHHKYILILVSKLGNANPGPQAKYQNSLYVWSLRTIIFY